MQSSSYEAVVVGGGPAGAVAAATLARRGHQVLLLDAGRGAKAFVGGESLPPLAPTLHTELGIGAVVGSGEHQPCFGTASAWGSAQVAYRSFIHSPYGTGWHLDRPYFDRQLRQQAVANGAELAQGQLRKVQALGPGGWGLTVRHQDETRWVQAGWLLDCSGRARTVSRQLGVGYDVADHLVAYVRRYRLSTESFTAREQLTLTQTAAWGWGHTAPLPGGDRVVTLFTDSQLGATMELGTAAGFEAAVAHLPHLTSDLTRAAWMPVGVPQATDARSGRLRELCGPGWVAAGDAAATCDPLAAQGILAAVWGGHQAALALASCLPGRNITPALTSYAEQVARRFVRLRNETAGFYARERRWPEAAFWQARKVPANVA